MSLDRRRDGGGDCDIIASFWKSKAGGVTSCQLWLCLSALFAFAVTFPAADLAAVAALPTIFSTLPVAFGAADFGFEAGFDFVLVPPKMRSQLSPKLGVEPVRTIGPLISTIFPLETLHHGTACASGSSRDMMSPAPGQQARLRVTDPNTSHRESHGCNDTLHRAAIVSWFASHVKIHVTCRLMSGRLVILHTTHSGTRHSGITTHFVRIVSSMLTTSSSSYADAGC